jgi:hypothetical protein
MSYSYYPPQSLYSSAIIAPVLPITPAPVAPIFNQLDNLPQPTPPAGWTISQATTTVKQDYGSIEFTYEYKYAPLGKEYKTLPAAVTPPAGVPPYWKVTKSTHSVEKEEKHQIYKYVLKYSEPPAAKADEKPKK